jgi:hypothetical protein
VTKAWTRALLACLACGAPAASAVEARYLVSAQLDVRARSPMPGSGAVGAAADVELDPMAEGGLLWGPTRLSLSYSPSFLLRDLQGLGDAQYPTTTVLLHRGRFSLNTTLSDVVLSFSEEAAYGEQDVTGLRAAEGALPNAIPQLATLGVTPYFRSGTLLSLSGAFSREVGYTASASYLVAGDPSGLDASYPLRVALGVMPLGALRQNPMPFQYGPAGSLGLVARATPSNTFTTLLNASEAQFVHQDQGPRRGLPVTPADQLLVGATENWAGTISPVVTVGLGAGVAYIHQRVAAWQGLAGASDVQAVLPQAFSNLAYRFTLEYIPGTLSASLRLAPYLDPFSGLIYDRIEGQVLSRWGPIERVSFAAGVSGAVAVSTVANGPTAPSLFSADLSATWAPVQWFSLAGALRGLYTTQATGVAAGFQWAATVSVIVRYNDSTAW